MILPPEERKKVTQAVKHLQEVDRALRQRKISKEVYQREKNKVSSYVEHTRNRYGVKEVKNGD